MGKKIEKVELDILDIPGALGQVIGHIRHEGWNISCLHVEETLEPGVSHLEMNVEGVHTKLAQVAARMLQLDCVRTVITLENGKQLVHHKKVKQINTKEIELIEPVGEKARGELRILTINPGATSTKFALYDDEKPILVHVIRHEKKDLDACGSVHGQKHLRKKCIEEVLLKSRADLKSIDAISGRGGLLKPIESGTYYINQAMIEDLSTDMAAVHASSLGALIASEFAEELGVPAFVVDPIVVDEMERHAKLSGIPGIERTSIFHTLNQKAIARRVAQQLNKPYANSRFVVAHLGGGITVGAHRYGRVVDVNDALAGEGAFTPERSGSIPAVPLIHMCFSGEYSKEEMLDKVVKGGGLLAYLGTNDLKKVQKMINGGDEFAALVLDSMAYQVSKEIGAMTAVLEGRVDAIILTGGLAYSDRFTGAIKEKVDKLAPVYVYPGEDEMLALMQGALRVLRGQEAAIQYE